MIDRDPLAVLKEGELRRHWAVCVTGELRSAACKAKEGPEGSTPALSQRKKVLGLLWGANVTHDTFLVLDGRANSSAQASSLLRHVVGALRPVAVALDKPEDEAEAWSRYQLGPGRVTRAAAAYGARSVAQARKLRICYQMLQRREQDGWPYTHVRSPHASHAMPTHTRSSGSRRW